MTRKEFRLLILLDFTDRTERTYFQLARGQTVLHQPLSTRSQMRGVAAAAIEEGVVTAST